MKILAIGIDSPTRQFLLSRHVVVENISSTTVHDEGLQPWLFTDYFDLAVMDFTRTKLEMYCAQELRREDISIPLIGIVKKPNDTLWSDVRADFLEMGGDDLVEGPGNMRELLASATAIIRRARGLLSNKVEFRMGDTVLEVDLTTNLVWINEMEVSLTSKERAVLRTLALYPAGVISKDLILSNLYQTVDEEAGVRTIDVYIYNIRNKFSDIRVHASGFIETLRGQGYRLVGRA